VCHGRAGGRRDRKTRPRPGAHEWPGGLTPGDRLLVPGRCHSPSPPPGMVGQAPGTGQIPRSGPGWYAGHCPDWYAGHCPGSGTGHYPDWYAGHCPGSGTGAAWNRSGRAGRRAPRAARTGPVGDHSDWANRRTLHRVTGPPARTPGARPERRPARSPRSGSSRFLARSPPVAAPAPPGASARSPPAASAENGAPARVASGQAQLRASAPSPAGSPAVGHGSHPADPAVCRAAGQTTGHRAGPARPAGDRSRSGLASQHGDRAASASHPTATGNRPAGRLADRRAPAADQPVGRPADHRVRCLVDHYARRPVDHPAGRPVDHSVRRPVDHSARRPLDHGFHAVGHPGQAAADADHSAGQPPDTRPGTAAGRSTSRSTRHRAVPRPGTAAGRSRNRNGQAGLARDPDTGCWRAHAAGTSRVGVSLRSACCALSPGQREITTSCGTQAFPRRHSCLRAAFGQSGRLPRSQRAGR